jgi:hypothetical protein
VKGETMKIPTANDYCTDFIQQWIDKVAHLPERHNIDAWKTQAEQAACNALENEDIVIEMRWVATSTLHTETLKIPRECFDWLELVDGVNL